jgi:pimeloyl-ACP methyl ester carboxylesterase
MPLILTHGWPWSFWEFAKVIGPLTDPDAHGGDPADAFDVVIPSLPGYGFSTPLTVPGINFWRTADLWVQLMRDGLGYDRFFAQGGDWGAFVTEQLAHRYTANVIAVHLTNTIRLDIFSGATPWMLPRRRSASHVAVHMLDPQTLAWACHDSPIGSLAWLLERRRAWSDCGGDVERRFSKDHLLTTAMLYWATGAFVTSIRYYAEAANNPWKPDRAGEPVVPVPTGVTHFEPDTGGPGPQPWHESYFNLTYWKNRQSGGHFAPWEEPEALVEDIRATFRPLR